MNKTGISDPSEPPARAEGDAAQHERSLASRAEVRAEARSVADGPEVPSGTAQ